MASTTQETSLPATFGGDDGDGNNKLTSGNIVKCVDGKWTVKNEPSFDPAGPFLALDADIGAQCWEGERVVDSRRRMPGVYLPDFCREMNAQIPQEQWDLDLNGNLREPWQLVWFVRLIRMSDGAAYTSINSTVGQRIGVNELREKVQNMRLLRGQNVTPIVKLSSLPFKAKMGPKQRPCFEITSWHFPESSPAAVAGPDTPKITGPKKPKVDLDADCGEHAAA
jgi:hypothetical protein